MHLSNFRVPAAIALTALLGSTATASVITAEKVSGDATIDQTLVAQAKSKTQSISIASKEGSASGTITWTGTKSFNYNVTVKSKKGNSVYVQAKGYRDFVPDTLLWARMTENTTNTGGQTFSGSISGGFGSLKLTGVKLRVCKDVRFGRDKCGPSKNYPRQ
ncbi:MAG: hypothetical protein AB1861_07120 [Cyanobacteriota bacterium]